MWGYLSLGLPAESFLMMPAIIVMKGKAIVSWAAVYGECLSLLLLGLNLLWWYFMPQIYTKICKRSSNIFAWIGHALRMTVPCNFQTNMAILKCPRHCCCHIKFGIHRHASTMLLLGFKYKWAMLPKRVVYPFDESCPKYFHKYFRVRIS